MVDSALLIKMRLLQDADLLAMLGRYTVRRGDVPAKFNPILGACVTVSLHTGHQHPEVTPIRFDTVRIRVWAAVNQYESAWRISGEINRWLLPNMVDVNPYGFILSSIEQSSTEVTDPGPGESTGWSTVNSLYLIDARES
jgi:hypothetical protein